MSAAKKLPAGLPELPPVPEGWHAWELLGWGYDSKGAPAGAPWAYFFKHLPSTGWLNTDKQYMSAELDIRVSRASFAIRAIKRPAKRKQPKQAKAVKAVRAYGIPGEVKTIYETEERAKFFAGSRAHLVEPVDILPADKASVERMREQAMRAIINDPMATLGDTITAVFASIGITSTKGRQ